MHCIAGAVYVKSVNVAAAIVDLLGYSVLVGVSFVYNVVWLFDNKLVPCSEGAMALSALRQHSRMRP